MDKFDAVLGIVELAGKKIRGRTTLQKLGYFASVAGIADITYKPHYYGPYSEDLASAETMLVSVGLLNEKVTVLGPQTDGWLQTVSGDVKAYSYSLTPAGAKQASLVRKQHPADWKKLKQIVEVCEESAGLRAGVLAAASKVHYLATNERVPLNSPDKVAQTAEKFGWELSSDQIQSVGTLLSRLKLISKSRAVPAG